MGDGDDVDHNKILDDPVDDPVFAATRRVEGEKGWLELFAHPLWVLTQRADDEVPRSSRDLLGKILSE